MPRARKTISGAKAMAASDIPGQMYGKGVEQAQLQKAMPAPQVQQPKAVTPQPTRQRQAQAAAPAPLPAGQPQRQMPQDNDARLAAAFAQLRGQTGGLARETARPNEPVTTGLPVGPGAGPEVMQGAMQNPLGQFLRSISQASGDGYFAILAERFGL